MEPAGRAHAVFNNVYIMSTETLVGGIYGYFTHEPTYVRSNRCSEYHKDYCTISVQ